MRSTSTLYIYMTRTKNGTIPDMVARLPFIETEVPVLAVFKLLGVDDRDEVLRLIVGDAREEDTRLLRGILDNDRAAEMTRDELIEWIGREGTKEQTRERRAKYMQHIITDEILPHMGLTLEPAVMRAKAMYLGFMVRKLLSAHTGAIQCDDRDHYANKRLDTAGMLMSLLFRQVLPRRRGVVVEQVAEKVRRCAAGVPRAAQVDGVVAAPAARGEEAVVHQHWRARERPEDHGRLQVRV